jgi:hypothetical protein
MPNFRMFVELAGKDPYTAWLVRRPIGEQATSREQTSQKKIKKQKKIFLVTYAGLMDLLANI